MFLLALTALLLLALGFSAYVFATGNKAAMGAAAREGMPAKRHTNHPAHLREARLANDASNPPASAGVCPASESDDLDTRNHTIAAHTDGFPASASPHLMQGLALGAGHGWADQPLLLRESRAHGPGLSSCTASPRPRIRCGEAAGVEVGAACTTRTALTR